MSSPETSSLQRSLPTSTSFRILHMGCEGIITRAVAGREAQAIRRWGHRAHAELSLWRHLTAERGLAGGRGTLPAEESGDGVLRSELRALGRADGVSALRRLSGGAVADTWLVTWSFALPAARSTPVSHSSTSVTEFRAQNLLMALGQVGLGGEGAEERQVTLVVLVIRELATDQLKGRPQALL